MTSLGAVERVAPASDPGDTLLRAKRLARLAVEQANPPARPTSADPLQRLQGTPLLVAARRTTDISYHHSLANSIEVNDAALDFVLTSPSDPVVMAYAAALITQRALYDHVDAVSGKTRRDLSAAKRAGTFFTPPGVALAMADLALDGRARVNLALEPAAGTGMLTAALLHVASKRGISIESVQLWELSPYLASIADRVVRRAVELIGSRSRVDVVVGDAIDLFEARQTSPDVIVLNPPYGRVKYLRSEATNAETQAGDAQLAHSSGLAWVEATQVRYAAFARRIGLREKGLDHQRVFLAASLDCVAHDGTVVAITPSSWLSGAQSLDFRSQVVAGRNIRYLRMVPESAALFETVNQPTVVAVLDKSGGHREIEIETWEGSAEADRSRLTYTDIDSSNPVIPMIQPLQSTAYAKLRHLGRLHHAGIVSARGELDLTLDGWMLSAADGAQRQAVRGDRVDRYELLPQEASGKASAVSPEGIAHLSTRPKWRYVDAPRIAGRQVAYMGKKRRLAFAYVDAGSVVTNSCNFISADDEKILDGVLGYLNSAVAEWWFRVHSANNHVSNSELNNMPWPLASEELLQLVAAAASIRVGAHGDHGEGVRQRAEELIDAAVCLGVGLTSRESSAVLSAVLSPEEVDRRLATIDWLRRYGVPKSLESPSTWLQHLPNTLSALDRLMISHVPVGGNWQQIPPSVPSKRLDQIREMARNRGVVRTTYYGRLRPDQPSYTVATYYNRPGNGTNIHPVEDRTLSDREASRLQSFPDHFSFIGSEGSVRTQIGNAVPPLLGMAVANRLKAHGLGDGHVVDLFCGAGGLSLGFELAGVTPSVAADNNASALRTYAFNRPSEWIADPASARTLVMDADLSDAHTREVVYAAIDQKLRGERVSALIGGPPCQGFSHAGFRDSSDPRSDLAISFLDFVEALEPEMVVLENVEGILSAKRGRVAAELIATLRELGYQIEAPWTLAAEQYGVPQMRRRVFFVASKSGIIAPPEPHFERCLGRREVAGASKGSRYPITVDEALMDLPPIEGHRLPAPISHYARWARGEIGAEQMLQDRRSAQ